MTNNNQETQDPHKKLVQVQVIIEQVVGNTYPHRKFLKQIGCSWKPDEKCWERFTIFTESEIKQIIDLGLTLQRKILE